MRAALLALDLFGLDDLRVRKPHAAEDERQAGLELADKGLPAGAGAPLEGVAVDRILERSMSADGTTASLRSAIAMSAFRKWPNRPR